MAGIGGFRALPGWAVSGVLLAVEWDQVVGVDYFAAVFWG